MDKDSKRTFIKLPYEYVLYRGGQRRFCLTFESLEDLRSELSRYFTPKEINSGIVDRLTTFNEKLMKDYSVKNSYQVFDIICNYEDTEVLLYDKEGAVREQKLGLFDVCSPQECADLFGKPVMDGDKLYFPGENQVKLSAVPTEILQEMSKEAFSKYYAEATKPCGNWQPGTSFPDLEKATNRLNEINDELERRSKLLSLESKVSLSEQVSDAAAKVKSQDETVRASEHLLSSQEITIEHEL